MGLFRTTALARHRRKRRRGPLAAAQHAVGPRGPLRKPKGPFGAKGPLRSAKGPAVRRPSWKLIGLAGLAGVAATGAAVARSRRAHSELEPDELRERLRERLAAAGQADQPPVSPE